nr:copper amine oxidase N-terminal domain-containing protein [Alkalihalophilus marmarensis]
MTLGSRTALVNGRAVTMSVAPQARSGRTLVPLRFVAEASGKKVEWSSKARMILINDGVYERINTTLTKNDLNRSILDNARRGYLGPFHYSDITGYSTRPLGDVVNKFGMPDERYNGTDASDDRPFIYYGNYAISIIGTSNTHYLKNPRATGLSMYFNERLTPQDVTRALGPPDAKEIGMYDYLDYYVGDYVLSVVYYDNSVYYFELYKR